jgi:hypothetical protein
MPTDSGYDEGTRGNLFPEAYIPVHARGALGVPPGERAREGNGTRRDDASGRSLHAAIRVAEQEFDAGHVLREEELWARLRTIQVKFGFSCLARSR